MFYFTYTNSTAMFYSTYTTSTAKYIQQQGCFFHYAAYIFPSLLLYCYSKPLSNAAYFGVSRIHLSRLFLLPPPYLLADYCIMKNKDIKFTWLSWFILNSQCLLPCFSFYYRLRLFKQLDLICHSLKSSCSWVPQDTNHPPCTAEGQKSSWTTSQAGGDWVPPVPPVFCGAALVSMGCPGHLSPLHQVSGTYSSISSKTQLTQGHFLWQHCTIINQVAQPHLTVRCSSNEPAWSLQHI